MKASVWLLLWWVCLFSKIVAQTHYHLPAYVMERCHWDLVFIFLYFSGAPHLNTHFIPDTFFMIKMPLCPFWTSCNMLSKQCQSRWWQWKISVPSEAAGGRKQEAIRFRTELKCVTHLVSSCLHLHLHQPLGPVKSCKFSLHPVAYLLAVHSHCSQHPYPWQSENMMCAELYNATSAFLLSSGPIWQQLRAENNTADKPLLSLPIENNVGKICPAFHKHLASSSFQCQGIQKNAHRGQQSTDGWAKCVTVSYIQFSCQHDSACMKLHTRWFACVS